MAQFGEKSFGEEIRALWYVEPGRAELRDERLGGRSAGSLRVRSRYGAISRGTESIVMAGRVPASEWSRMRAPFMAGTFPFPVKYGYATVGTVEDGDAGVALGTNVFVLHPHQNVFDVPPDAVAPLPDTVAPRRAVLAANMETALNAAWDAGPGPFRHVAVVGAGVVGTLTGYVLARIGTAPDVTLIDLDPARRALAEQLGLAFATPAQATGDCDLVVHASASAAGLATAFELAGDEAIVLELSWYGAGDVPVPLGGAFHSRRLKLVSSQVGKVAPSHRATHSHRQRLLAAIGLLDDPRLDALLAPSVPFDELPSALPQILRNGSGVLCQVIDYPAADRHTHTIIRPDA